MLKPPLERRGGFLFAPVLSLAVERLIQNGAGYEGGDGTVDVDSIPLYPYPNWLRLTISPIKPLHAGRAVISWTPPRMV